MGRSFQVRHQGPGPASNWLIQGKLLVGECPLSSQESQLIFKQGIDTFISLLDDVDHRTHITRKAYLAATEDALGIQTIWVPIPDGDVTTDKVAFKLAHDIVDFLQRGGKAYLHCWGGHGRAGTIGAMTVGLWNVWNLSETLCFLQKSHKTRKEGGEIDTPQSIPQVQQIARFFKANAKKFGRARSLS